MRDKFQLPCHKALIMSSTTTLRNDTARTGTNPYFPINTNPWRKYVSVDLGTVTIWGNTTVNRVVRAGVLVVENWVFNTGLLAGQKHTLVLVATTTNEVYCFNEEALLTHGAAATPLWHTSLGVTPMMRAGSNISSPVGICGTPVVDVENRRMFVIAMWDDGQGTGNYSIFEIALDTGSITRQQRLADTGAQGQRATFIGDLLDQRTAINLVNGWLWMGFADYQADDRGRYYGWVVAIKADDFGQQLYQPTISLDSSNNWGIFAGGVWGPGGVAAAANDGSVYALTGNATQLDPSDVSGNNPVDNLTSFGKNYWQHVPATGPGSLGDYFNALVRLAIVESDSGPQIKVLDWFQGSNITREENTADFDFGGSSPVVLPPINGRQLVAFVPNDGNIFVLDSQNLGHYATPLILVNFANALVNGGDDTKVAIAFLLTHDKRNILFVAADSKVVNPTEMYGGFAAFQVDVTATTQPTLTKLWQSPFPLNDSFGSPAVIANLHVANPSSHFAPNPVGLVWIINGQDAHDNFLSNCIMRAYDVLTGAIIYDSSTHDEVTEEIPHFAPITSGGNSVFCATSRGFMGFTQQPSLQ